MFQMEAYQLEFKRLGLILEQVFLGTSNCLKMMKIQTS